jgi:hypothetical protein
VLERGPLVTARLMPTLGEEAGLESLYDGGGGAVLSADGAVTLLAGAAVGGGSLVNWCGCLRTTEAVIQARRRPPLAARCSLTATPLPPAAMAACFIVPLLRVRPPL